MIIFENSFLLSEATTDTPLTHARIGWHNVLRDFDASNVAVSGETASGPRDAPLRPDTYSYWEPPSLPASWQINLAPSQDVDYVGIVGNFGSSQAAVTVETTDGSLSGSPSEEVWTTFASAIAPGDDAPLLFLDDLRSISRLRILVTGVSEVPKLAVVYAGQILKMERSIYGGHAPVTLNRVTALYQALSKGGQFLGQSFRSHGQKGQASFRHLTPSWYRANFDPFVKAARRYPYFFAWRPADYPLEVGYVWTPEDIGGANMGLREFMQVSWQMNGWGYE